MNVRLNIDNLVTAACKNFLLQQSYHGNILPVFCPNTQKLIMFKIYAQAFGVHQSQERRKFARWHLTKHVRDVKWRKQSTYILDCPIRSQRTCPVHQPGSWHCCRQRQNTPISIAIRIKWWLHDTHRQLQLYLITTKCWLLADKN